MKTRVYSFIRALFLMVGICPWLASGQTLSLTNGSHHYTAITNTVVTLSGRCELHVEASTSPIPGCLINLDSPDAWFYLSNVRPSVVASSHLQQVRVNNVLAVQGSNVRVVQYGPGTVVIPHSSTFQPLEVFSGPNFTGSSRQLGVYTYYNTPAALGAMNQAISSFKLKHGYMATVATGANGNGTSKVYIAQDGDLDVGLLPAALDNAIQFVRVFPWRWVGKKGSCDVSPTLLDATWYYNWNNDQESTLDYEYVPIRQQRWWPAYPTFKENCPHLLGFNEPNNPEQDAYGTLDNGSVDAAIAVWPELLATGLRVGSPAVTDGGEAWLYDFINKADAADLRVDFVAIHFYRCGYSATQLRNWLYNIHLQTGRPLWVTEFNNGANWTTCADPTLESNAAAIESFIQMMDNEPWIERYAVYSNVEATRRIYDSGALTPAGINYRDNTAPIGHMQALPATGSRAIAQLPFDGAALDRSGYANHGFEAATPVYTPGHAGQAIEFDGTNNFVQLTPDMGDGTDFTFAAWVWWDGEVANGQWQRIFDLGQDTSQYMFLTPTAFSHQLRFAITTAGYNGEQRLESGPFPVGQWVHVAVTLNGNTGVLYTNGVAADTASIVLNPSSFHPANNYLGKSQFAADPLFDGKLDEVLFADYALTPAQIASLLTNQPPAFTSNTLVRPNAEPDNPYSNSVAGEAADPDTGDSVTYSKATGPDWLTITSNGVLSGTPGGLDGGTNEFTVCATDAAGMSAFTVLSIYVPIIHTSGTWISDASGTWSTAARWSGAQVASGAGFTADFSTINITANRTVILDTDRSLGTLKFGDTSGAQSWTVSASGGSELTLDTGVGTSPSLVVNQNTATIAAPVSGVSGFTKSGAGILVLSGNNALSGTVNVDTGSTSTSEGAVRAAHPAALTNVSAIQIRNNNSGSSTLKLDGTAGGVTVPANLAVSCRNNDIPTLQNLAGTNTLSGATSLNVGGNRFNIRSDAGLLVINGPNQYVGSLTGARTYAFSGSGDHLVNGPILNSMNGAPISLTKSGTGALTLAGNNTYGSTTVVSGGTLRVNGSTAAASAVTVANTATLGGSGTIGGAVTVQAGGSLAPGAGIGRLTVNNNLSLQSGSTLRMEINKSQKTNDLLFVSSTLTLNGTLIVTNLGGALEAGDSFTLFQSGLRNGSFASYSLPTLEPGLGWDTNSLTTGVLKVVQTVATNPTNIVSSLAGNQLTLTWPAGHTGWRVETNAGSLGDSNAWFTLPDSTTTNRVILQMDPGPTHVFYRLVFP